HLRGQLRRPQHHRMNPDSQQVAWDEHADAGAFAEREVSRLAQVEDADVAPTEAEHLAGGLAACTALEHVHDQSVAGEGTRGDGGGIPYQFASVRAGIEQRQGAQPVCRALPRGSERWALPELRDMPQLATPAAQ